MQELEPKFTPVRSFRTGWKYGVVCQTAGILIYGIAGGRDLAAAMAISIATVPIAFAAGEVFRRDQSRRPNATPSPMNQTDFRPG